VLIEENETIHCLILLSVKNGSGGIFRVQKGVCWNFGYIVFEQGYFVHVSCNPQRQQY
jgi:hypothetical protein